MTESRDHYQVLGLTPAATAEEIRSAHRRLVHVLHPDLHHEASPAERALADRRMREINDAWNTLGDPLRRKDYDSTVMLGKGSFGGADRPSPTTPPAASGRPSGRYSSGPGSSASAGSGAYWRANGTRQPRTNVGGSSVDSRDQAIAVSPRVAFLIRRGPIVVIAVVVLGLLIVTAYVGGDRDTMQVRPPPLEACAKLIEGRTAVLVPCDSPNDGEVVAQVDAALDCPPEATYVMVGTDFYCRVPKGQRTEGG